LSGSAATCAKFNTNPGARVFFFLHPKPFSRKEVAVQTVARSGTPPLDTTLIVIETRTPANVPAAVEKKTPSQ
jgi:hypothetical protein